MDRNSSDFKKSLISCFINYLKSVDVLSRDYPNSDAPAKDCMKLIEFMKTFDDNSMGLFKQHGIDADCMAEELARRKMKEYNMLELVYEASETMTDQEKEEKMKQARAKAEEATDRAVDFCSTKAHYSRLFDETIASENNTHGDVVGSYCARKYAVVNKLIDKKVHKVVLNPLDADVSNVDCTAKLMELTKSVEDTVKQQYLEYNKDCVVCKHREENMIDQIIKLFVLSELKITDEERKKAKESFVGKMMRIYSKLPECAKTIECACM
jgi:hypothetical protein